MPLSNSALLARLRSLAGAQPVLDALAGEPGVHAVGGVVRDLLLGLAPRELDLVVEGDAPALARRLAERLGARAVVHEPFGTAVVRFPDGIADLASARTERYPRPGALPQVTLGASLEQDLRRRDFTVNAIALRLADGALTSHPGAEQDLAARRLRVLHPASFRDDPTRLLRMARYAARLGFAIEEETAALAADAVAGGAIATVSARRVGSELRLLAGEPQPDAVLALERLELGRAALDPRFAAGPPVADAVALCPPDAAPGLAALAAACLDVPPAELAARLDELGFAAGERDTVVAAVAGAASLAAALAAAGAPSAIWRAARHQRPETVALAGALGPRDAARRWLGELRHVRPAVAGADLLAAGVSGPAVGRGLEAATALALDGAADREEQLAAALAAARAS